METEYDLVIRVVAFLAGLWTAMHYFLGANALLKAAHWVKLILFPSLVMNGVGVCFASVVYGSGMVFLLAAPLVILKAHDLEAAVTAVTAAGGEIVKPIFAFPGGRRFHFVEPSGNEFAVWSESKN